MSAVSAHKRLRAEFATLRRRGTPEGIWVRLLASFSRATVVIATPLPQHVHAQAMPLDTNMLEVHYVLKGPDDSPYAGGFCTCCRPCLLVPASSYHCCFLLPPDLQTMGTCGSLRNTR